jgi:hypothetical protein
LKYLKQEIYLLLDRYKHHSLETEGSFEEAVQVLFVHLEQLDEVAEATHAQRQRAARGCS